MKNAIIYARASTREQSNKVQVKQLEDYCANNGIEVVRVFQENVSGASARKEQLDTILYSDSMADMLVIREISRLSREKDYIAALSKVNELAKKYTIYILADNYTVNKGDVLSMTDGLLLIVKLYAASDEREKIALRTKTARQRYKENPFNNSAGQVPYGLKKVPNPNYVKGVNTKMVFAPDGEKYDKVMEVFRLKADGLSLLQVSHQVGLSKDLVRNILRNARLRNFVPEWIANAADESSRKNDNSPNPTKHDNIFKGLIFDGYTGRTMAHKATKHGSMYSCPSEGAIMDKDLEETVKRALNTFCREMHVKADSLAEENEEKAKELLTRIQALHDVQEKKSDELSTLRKKAVQTSDMALYGQLNDRIADVSSEVEKIGKEMDAYRRQVEAIRSIELEDVEVTDENLPYMVGKFVKKVLHFSTRKFVRTIRVIIKDEFVPSWAENYKDYEVVRNRAGNSITALPYSEYDLTEDLESEWGVTR